MNKFFSIHKTNRGVSVEVQKRITELKRLGYRMVVLSPSQPRLRYRNITIHLYDPKYSDLFEKARTAVERARVNVEYPCGPVTTDSTTPSVKESEAPAEPAVVETDNPEVDGSEKTDEPAVVKEESETAVEESSPLGDLLDPDVSFEAVPRSRKSKNLPVYVYDAPECPESLSDLLAELFSETASTENPVHIDSEHITLDDIPSQYKERTVFVAGQDVDLDNIRAVLTNDAETAALCIEQAVPVYLTGVKENEFTLSTLSGIVDASVPSTESRQTFLDNLPRNV